MLAVSNVLSAYLCDPSAALRFIGFTAVITAEPQRDRRDTQRAH
jgi:hypothetical protein